MSAQRQRRGFTLLEMIVVLAIASMALALGFQSLGQWQRAEEVLARLGGAARAATLTESWWRESVRGLKPLADVATTGDARRLSGFTLAPVLASPGATTPFSWEVATTARAGTTLTLKEQDRSLTLALPEVVKAHFLYQDASGKLQGQWPPALGVQAPLPTAIALVQTLADGRQRIWISAIAGETAPHYEPFEMEED